MALAYPVGVDRYDMELGVESLEDVAADVNVVVDGLTMLGL